jgi:hypothetical protein
LFALAITSFIIDDFNILCIEGTAPKLEHLKNNKMTSNTNDDADSFEINLKTDAEGQYADWVIKIEDSASSLCVKVLGEGGLLNVGIGMTTVAWQRENPGVERPAARVKPVLLQAQPTVAEREANKILLDEWHLIVEATTELKKEIVGDLSPALKKATWDVATGHRNVTITNFLDFMHTRFGAVSDSNLKKIKKLISTVWLSELNLETQFEVYKSYHAKLVLLGQPRCESDKLEVFEIVTASLPNVVYYLKKYYEDHAMEVNARNLNDALAFILSQQLAGLFTAGAQAIGWVGGSSAANDQESAILQRIAAAVKEALRNQKLSTETRVPAWCFKHGPGHSGVHCKYMLARPQFFSADYLKATHECTIRGVKSYPAQVGEA